MGPSPVLVQAQPAPARAILDISTSSATPACGLPGRKIQCMSPKSAQRFWENDMHQNKDLKRVA
ncbi:MAG: hypothetical protein EOS40_02930 [Mesorhizobium sp.]|nr:MAG: hypothetical protein EOQ40_06620 [Mesorhizobium sp.]RWE03458.1 MAG: hypothetical protein EOS40_02930 [Mesorhizobium sp.]TIS51031.1 MAG: hypothetical protein E5W96_05005 [Mesorhizobium sp.]